MSEQPPQERIAELEAELEAEGKRAHDAERKAESLIVDQARHDRRVWAVARRTEQDIHRKRADDYTEYRVSQAITPVTGLVHRVLNAGERAGTKKMAELQDAAKNAQYALRMAGRAEPSEVTYGDQMRAEVERLRTYIAARARELQTPEYGHLGPDCHCRGCELLIGMDDVLEEQHIDEEE